MTVALATMPEASAGERSATQVEISQALVVAFVAGDRTAFRRMFDLLGRSLLGTVARYFRSPFDQEEAQQEVWLQLHRVRGSFDVNRWGAFPSWARQVARNRCLDLLKSRKRKNTHEVPLPSVEGEPAAVADGRASGQLGEGDQMKAVFDSRVRQALNELVSRLDEEQRQFFGCCFVEELAHEQIARRLGITVRRSKYLKKKLLAQMVACAPLREMGGS